MTILRSITLATSLLALAAACASPGSHTWIQSHGGGTITRYTSGPPAVWELELTEADARTWVYFEGEPTLSPDGREIVALESGAIVRVRERNAAGIRELELRAADEGGVAHDYRRDGEVAEFDPAARAWLAHVLHVVQRNTTIGAESRARHLLAERGPTALVEELALLGNDGLREVYARVLLDSALERESALALAREGVASFATDAARATVLCDLATRFPDDAELSEALIADLTLIHASAAQRAFAEILAEERALSTDARVELVASTAGIAVESERAAALAGIVRCSPPDDRVLARAVDAAGTIAGSGPRVGVLTAVLEKEGASAAAVRKVAAAASTVPTESARASLLERIVARPETLDDTLVTALRSAATISSASGRAQVYGALLARRPAAPPGVFTELAAGLESTPSDDTRGRMLAEYFRAAPADPAVLARGIEVAASIGSSSSASLALESLLERGELDRATLARISEAARGIASAEARAALLLRVNQRLVE